MFRTINWIALSPVLECLIVNHLKKSYHYLIATWMRKRLSQKPCTYFILSIQYVMQQKLTSVNLYYLIDYLNGLNKKKLEKNIFM